MLYCLLVSTERAVVGATLLLSFIIWPCLLQDKVPISGTNKHIHLPLITANFLEGGSTEIYPIR